MTTDGWQTLTEAATRTGYSREALRLRVRRGKLRAVKGNDGVLRVDPQDLSHLPTPDDPAASASDPGQTPDNQGQALEVIGSLLDEVWSSLDKANADRLVDHGRAERAEAQLQAALESVRVEVERRTLVEARLAATEAVLLEARTPWIVRVVKGLRRL